MSADADWKANRTLATEHEAVQRELSDAGRVLIRASGTEPLLRVMVEGEPKQLVEQAANSIAVRRQAGCRPLTGLAS